MAMKAKGFTLIELMVVVTILGIIMAIAIPAYNGQVEKSRRADAHSALTNAAQQLERCFTRTNTYVGCNVPALSPDEFYTLTAVRTATTFTLSAQPRGAQTSDNCGTFTLDHRGIRGDDGAPTDRCWGS